MSHMFCTLQEAAQTLNTSEDEIRALLERGLLREFREGPHRLLKEADVNALARQQAQGRAAESAAAPSCGRGAKASHPAGGRRPPSAPAASRPLPAPRTHPVGPAPPPRGMRVPDRRAMPPANGPAGGAPWDRASGPRAPDRRPSRRLPLRQWFWMGLVQDRPGVIALLAGLVLALLAAGGAGLCLLVRAS